MNNDRFKSIIYNFWGGEIKDLNFDLLNNKISFSISLNYNDHSEYHILNFLNVSSFYFLNDSGKERFKLLNSSERSPEYYLELTEIEYYENGIGEIHVKSKSHWQEYSSANFLIEIWNHMLLIEAEIVQINDEIFKVGFPKDELDV